MDVKGKEKEKEEALSKKLIDVLEVDVEEDHVDLLVTFTKMEGGDILKGTPPVRVFFS